jgi:hypothetical protein
VLWEGGVNVFHSLRLGSPRLADDCSARFALGLEPRFTFSFAACDPELLAAELFVSLLAEGGPALGLPDAAAEAAPRSSVEPVTRDPAVTGLK